MFNIGDVVQVKSGGPAMTVLANGELIECLWFADVTEAFHREQLPAICLEAVELEEDDEKSEDEEDDKEDGDEDEDEDEDEDDGKDGDQKK